MALTINKPSDYGVDATYWRILSYAHDFVYENTIVQVGGYLSKDTREADATAMMNAQVIISEDQFNPDATRASIYDIIKGLPEFEGSIDA